MTKFEKVTGSPGTIVTVVCLILDQYQQPVFKTDKSLITFKSSFFPPHTVNYLLSFKPRRWSQACDING